MAHEKTKNEFHSNQKRKHLKVRASTSHISVAAHQTNAIGATFKLVLEERIRLLHQSGDPLNPDRPLWKEGVFLLRIVEALRGTWLSRITEYYKADPISAYHRDVIYLMTRDHASWFARHACFADSYPSTTTMITSVYNDPAAFPDGDLYQRGHVPKRYDEWFFDPDKLRQGQRFYMLEFEEADPQVVEITKKPKADTRTPGWTETTWVGVGVQIQGALFLGRWSAEAVVYNLADLRKWIREQQVEPRWLALELKGWKGGLGGGGGGNILLLIGTGLTYPADFNRDLEYEFDFDLELGAKLDPALKGAFNSISILKNIKLKDIKLGIQLWEHKEALSALYDIGKAVAESVNQEPGIHVLDGPGSGLQVWGGWKGGTVEYIRGGGKFPNYTREQFQQDERKRREAEAQQQEMEKKRAQKAIEDYEEGRRPPGARRVD